jgi:hypothetical protein
VPYRFNEKGIWFQRVGWHWVNNVPYVCAKESAPEIGGGKERCEICELVDDLAKSVNDRVSEKARRMQLMPQWLVFALIYERDDGQGDRNIITRPNKLHEPWEIWLYRNDFTTLLGMYERYLKRTPKTKLSILDPNDGCDMWIEKTKKGFVFDREDSQPIGKTPEDTEAILAKTYAAIEKRNPHRPLTGEKLEDLLIKIEDTCKGGSSARRRGDDDEDRRPARDDDRRSSSSRGRDDDRRSSSRDEGRSSRGRDDLNDDADRSSRGRDDDRRSSSRDEGRSSSRDDDRRSSSRDEGRSSRDEGRSSRSDEGRSSSRDEGRSSSRDEGRSSRSDEGRSSSRDEGRSSRDEGRSSRDDDRRSSSRDEGRSAPRDEERRRDPDRRTDDGDDRRRSTRDSDDHGDTVIPDEEGAEITTARRSSDLPPPPARGTTDAAPSRRQDDDDELPPDDKDRVAPVSPKDGEIVETRDAKAGDAPPPVRSGSLGADIRNGLKNFSGGGRR